MRIAIFFLSLVVYCLPSQAAWNKVQSAINYCGDSASTCTVSIATPVAGHVLVAVAFYSGTASVSSACSGTGCSGTTGGWVHPASCKATASGGQTIDMAYSVSAIAQTDITVTFTAAVAFGDLQVFEYAGGVSPFTFDKCATATGTTSSVNAGSLTTTGTNVLAIAAATASADWATSIAVSPAPWVTPTTMVNGQEVIANALGLSASTTQAVFTAAAAVTSAGVTIAFKDSTVAAGVRKRVNVFWSMSDGSAAAVGGTNFLAQAEADTYSNNSGSALSLNEGHPHGVPSGWDQWAGAYIVDGNNPCNSMTTAQCNSANPLAFVYWGVAYADSTGNPATNSRVNVKACNTYWYDTNATAWVHSGPYDQPEFGDYAEDFGAVSGDGNEYPSDTRIESDGSISVKLASGRVSHFFGPSARIPFAKLKWGGVVIECQARLIKDNSAGIDDTAIAKILVETGGDFYPAQTGPGIANNPGIGGGRMKYVTASWRSFAFSTLSYNAIMALPSQPPIDLTGLAP